MRLIDAYALKEELRNSWIIKAKMPMEADLFLAFAMSDIDNAPTIDAEPEKQNEGVIKEYNNGMVAMTYNTWKHYNDIAVREAVRHREID